MEFEIRAFPRTSARLAGNQLEGYDAIAKGEKAYPYGENAAKIGLTPGAGIRFDLEFDIWERPAAW